MKFEFLLVPTSNLAASLDLYRALGFTEAWREGEATVVLALPGTDTQIMLDANDTTAPSGPLFVVENVEAFHAARPAALTVVEEPSEIPGGFVATYHEPGGQVIYVMDQSTETAG